VNPVTGDRDFVTISESDEIAQGRKYHQSIIAQYDIYDDPALQKYVNQLGQALAAESHRKHLKFTFTVLDSPDINAFALPGGYIYITRGIMAYLNSEAEIAGVLGHEIGHVTARHSVRQQSGQLASGLFNVFVTLATGSESIGQLSNQLTTGIVRGYGRKHELEADKLGAQYLHKVGYDPESMLEVIGVLKDQEVYEKALAKQQNRQPNIYHGVYSTHPENDSRLKTVVRAAKKLSSKNYRENNSSDYLKMIDGMTWGQNIKQGVVVDNRFMHPELGIGIQFPQGWQLSNSAEALIARNFDNGAIVQMSMANLQDNESLQDFLKRQVGNGELSFTSHDSGASAKTKVTLAGKQQPARVTALKLNQSQTIFIIGTSSEKTFPEVDKDLHQINQSYTRLTKKQVAGIKAPEISIIKAGAGDSFSSLAKQSAINYDAENILRLLNRAFPSGQIYTGESLKIVTVDD
ncbi:MAG: M48 family metalloprotease, partial [Gammaproteobacteria bacterium]|nr:M48 family metalloprotease [Gammaproteobacteria bacterium]